MEGHETNDVQFEALLKFGWPVLKAIYGEANCCIAGTRTVIAVMKHFNVKASPLAVEVAIYNPLIHGRVKQLGRAPDAETINKWVTEDGGWTVGVRQNKNKPFEKDGWNGHLVAIIDVGVIEGATTTPRRILLDITAPQFNREIKDIVLSPIAIPVTSRFLKGLGNVSVEVNGCGVVYNALPKDSTYRSTQNWKAPNLSARNEILKVMDAADEYGSTDIDVTIAHP